MTSKERVKRAFNHQEPDRVPVFEIHIDSKPGSEILGHYAPTGIGGEVRKMQNEMTIAGKATEAQHWSMGRLRTFATRCRRRFAVARQGVAILFLQAIQSTMEYQVVII